MGSMKTLILPGERAPARRCPRVDVTAEDRPNQALKARGTR